MTPMQSAQTALTDLQDRYVWLMESLLPGTPRPYRTPTMTVEQRADADAKARLERLERIDIAPGESPDPIWSEGVELRGLILSFADNAAGVVAQTAGVDPLADAGWDSDALPFLRFVARWLLQASEADPPIIGRLRRKCELLVLRCDALLGHVTDGQTLDAACFVCDSRTDQFPTGGGRTLRVRTLHRGHRPAQVCGQDCRTLVVCEGGRCEPSEAECGWRFRGLPAWDLATEAGWLGERIGVRPRCPQCDGVVFRLSAGPTPHVYCSDPCAKAARRDAARAARVA